jgi:asparagine synthase (glutamine-hydrolysing)
MCGVAGVFVPGAQAHADEVITMVDQLHHRGPDDSGLHVEGPVALGHSRLAIQDLSDRAAQPMCSADGRWVLSYNGEIYNVEELRRRLTDRGVRFRSSGDTEALVEHVSEFGLRDTVPVLEGDWAFALFDRRTHRLVLARDRHGVKPLYWSSERPGVVRFASEVKALVGRSARPDMGAVNAALMGLAVTWGDRTMFRGVRAVRPGEMLTFDGSTEPEVWTYHRLTDLVDPDLHSELAAATPAQVVRRVRAAFEASIEMRMISDAPIACMASGGVDSTLVAAAAAQHKSDLVLYHADVHGDSEREHAEELARRLGLDLRVEPVSDTAFVETLAEVTWANDLPLIYHMNSVPFYLVGRLAASEGIKVLLTGEGSDEYFLGYPQYAIGPMLDAVQAAKGVLRDGFHRASPRLAQLLWSKPSESWAELLRLLSFGYEEQLVGGTSTAAAARLGRGSIRSTRDSLVLAQQHLTSLLHRNDRLGMAWSLESRFPFLGHDLTRLAVNLPSRLKLRGTTRLHDRRHPFVVDKWVIREVAAQLVPGGLPARAKQGFPVSTTQRLRISVEAFEGGFVADAFSLDRRALDEMIDGSPRSWQTRLLLMDVWGRQFVMGQSTDDVQKTVDRHVLVEAGGLRKARSGGRAR